MAQIDDIRLRNELGAVGAEGSELLAKERELLTGAGDVTHEDINGQKVFLGDAYRKSLREGTFTNISQDPFERARAQARLDLGIDAGDNVAFDTNQNLEGDLAELASNFGVSQEAIVAARRGKADTPVVSETGGATDLELQSFSERTSLPTDGQPIGFSDSYFDNARGVRVYAKPGQHFALYQGGGVRVQAGAPPQGQDTQASQTSLFGQREQGGKPVEGFKEENLGIAPAEGKEIARTGRTGKNPVTGVDVEVGPDEIFVEYTDGTFEIRKFDSINTPGEVKSLGQAGPTADELGITRQTEIKGGAGAEITRAPMSAREALQQAGTPEEKDAVLQQEGLAPTRDFEFIGKSYAGKTAGPGMAFYQHKATREIVERPEELESLAAPSTSPTVAAERRDIGTLFRAVFNREPSQEELKYWQGRKDKSGAALIGAMQFAKQQGAATGSAPGSGIGDPVQAMKAKYNDMQGRLAGAYTSDGITSRSSEKTAARAEIEALKAPEPASLTEFTKEQLAQTQFQEAVNELNQTKDALRKLDTDYINTLADAERTPGLSMGAIRRNQGELEIAYNRARRDLQVEVQMQTDIVQSQMAITEMMIDAFQYDQQQAQVEYQNKFNKAVAMYDIIAQEERDEFNMQQKLQDNMRANLSVVMSMVQDGSLDYNQLSGDQQAQIAYMEQAVGLSGVTQAIANTAIPPVVSMGSSITGPDGTVYTPIYSQNPRTGEITVSHYTHPFKERVPSGGGGATSLQKNLAIAEQFGIDPVNIVEAEFGLPLTQEEKVPMIGPLLPGQDRPLIGTGRRSPVQTQVDPSNFRSLGGGLYNVATGEYIPAPDEDDGDVY